MKLTRIISSRNLQDKIYNDVIYEWENILSYILECKIVNEQPLRHNKTLQKYKLSNLTTTFKNSLVFHMDPFNNAGYNKQNIIPWIIDYYATPETAKWLFKSYSRNKLVLISSKEANDSISRLNIPINNIHLALSLSDKYRITPQTNFQKKYDLVLLGRKSAKMEEYVNTYISKHPDLSFVSRDLEGNRLIARTNKGEYVADITDRDEYFKLLRASKAAIYTTAGMDGRSEWTNGFNQVTPRFLEFIASGCQVLCYYKQNSDTDYYEFNKYWPSIDSYDIFEQQLNNVLNNEVNMSFYSDYLAKHYTSVRAKELKQILEKY